LSLSFSDARLCFFSFLRRFFSASQSDAAVNVTAVDVATVDVIAADVTAIEVAGVGMLNMSPIDL
jgi:hypothetical protein